MFLYCQTEAVEQTLHFHHNDSKECKSRAKIALRILRALGCRGRTFSTETQGETGGNRILGVAGMWHLELPKLLKPLCCKSKSMGSFSLRRSDRVLQNDQAFRHLFGTLSSLCIWTYIGGAKLPNEAYLFWRFSFATCHGPCPPVWT